MTPVYTERTVDAHASGFIGCVVQTPFKKLGI